jgi:ornithine cyclodeaminase/alanine dehydrogenase-like protein (mu-crystallin family)
MDILYLSRADVEATEMSMKEVLQAVDNGFRLKGLGMLEMPPKQGIHPRADSFLHAMPCHVRDLDIAGMKWVSGYPANAPKGLPQINGLLILNDPDTGVPICVMDCTWITAMRTGASAGIAANYLARKDSAVIGLLGCGVQARAGLQALIETLPKIRQVKCRDASSTAARRFVDDMAKERPRLEFTTCGSAGEMMDGADVVVTAISIKRDIVPPLGKGMLKPGGLAVALDYDAAWTSPAMAECEKFVTDDTHQLLATKERGEYFEGIPEEIYGDLGDLAANLRPGRENAGERIFCLNMGIAVDDMVTAREIYERAVKKGIGTRLPL